MTSVEQIYGSHRRMRSGKGGRMAIASTVLQVDDVKRDL
jgi:hypothetical protein